MVRTDSGRLEPFDAGRLRRSLFAATVALGAPDRFLAGELADAVAHFLAEEYQGEVPTTAQVAEVTAKVVREVGQPALAAAYLARRGRGGEGPYSLAVREAHEAGLLRVCEIEEPGQLAACVTAPHRLREAPAPLVALDGAVGDVVAEVRRAGVRAVVNLNVDGAGGGGLFPGDAEEGRLGELVLGGSGVLLAVDWHVHGGEGLEEAARWAGQGVELGLVMRHARRPALLGLGLTRDCPGVLLRVGLNLVALANQPGLVADEERFLQRLGELARLAVEAAVQKRAHLRQLGAMAGGFLRERARLVAVVEGLDESVRLFTNWGLANGGPSLEMGRRVVGRGRGALREAGRAAQMEVALEVDVTGGRGMGVEAQLQAGSVQALADGGTLYLEGAGGEAVAAIREAWRQEGAWRVVLR